MNATTRFLTLIVASAPLVSCVAPPPPMPADPERPVAARPASAPRGAAPANSAPRSTASRPGSADPLPLSGPARRNSRSPLGDNVGVTGYFGRRAVDDFDPADNHLVFGLELDAYDEFSLFGFEGGFTVSDDSDTRNNGGPPVKVETDVFELYAGVRKTFTAGDGLLHPYLSAGLAYLNVNFAADSGPLDVEDQDTFGIYLRAGAYYRPSGMLRVGLDFRKLFGTHLSGTGGLDVDYDQLTLGVGVSL